MGRPRKNPETDTLAKNTDKKKLTKNPIDYLQEPEQVTTKTRSRKSKELQNSFTPVLIFHDKLKIRQGISSAYENYTPEEWLEKIQKYLMDCGDRTIQVAETDLGNPVLKKQVRIPTLQGLSAELGINVQTLTDWAKDIYKPEFLYAHDTIKNLQYSELINKGLSGEYNSAITKFMLMSNHGMADVTDPDTNPHSPSNNSLVINFVGPNGNTNNNSPASTVTETGGGAEDVCASSADIPALIPALEIQSGTWW